ncbi:hypothetical protein DPMN_040524 [Dreissena polymorpha]|uniref:Uncharacterized protein n=1 Tax=Dreissena polymorpha TaxID=45954 RepID=A0A9D4CWW3_DREPO|nr:hypothetical protein DPMN_040524 [Dreissena polymorpha]
MMTVLHIPALTGDSLRTESMERTIKAQGKRGCSMQRDTKPEKKTDGEKQTDVEKRKETEEHTDQPEQKKIDDEGFETVGSKKKGKSQGRKKNGEKIQEMEVETEESR